MSSDIGKGNDLLGRVTAKKIGYFRYDDKKSAHNNRLDLKLDATRKDLMADTFGLRDSSDSEQKLTTALLTLIDDSGATIDLSNLTDEVRATPSALLKAISNTFTTKQLELKPLTDAEKTLAKILSFYWIQRQTMKLKQREIVPYLIVN